MGPEDRPLLANSLCVRRTVEASHSPSGRNIEFNAAKNGSFLQKVFQFKQLLKKDERTLLSRDHFSAGEQTKDLGIHLTP
jgi:hypothetical protein